LGGPASQLGSSQKEAETNHILLLKSKKNDYDGLLYSDHSMFKVAVVIRSACISLLLNIWNLLIAWNSTKQQCLSCLKRKIVLSEMVFLNLKLHIQTKTSMDVISS
jgi:hypothetical protein